jgi:hypothetical protein
VFWDFKRRIGAASCTLTFHLIGGLGDPCVGVIRIESDESGKATMIQ